MEVIRRSNGKPCLGQPMVVNLASYDKNRGHPILLPLGKEMQRHPPDDSLKKPETEGRSFKDVVAGDKPSTKSLQLVVDEEVENRELLEATAVGESKPKLDAR